MLSEIRTQFTDTQGLPHSSMFHNQHSKKCPAKIKKEKNAPYMDMSRSLDRYIARPYLLASAAGGAAAASVASAAAAAGAAGSEVSPPKPTFFSHWHTLAGHECRPLSQTDTHLGQGSGSGSGSGSGDG